jgi:hypothetical protein
LPQELLRGIGGIHMRTGILLAHCHPDLPCYRGRRRRNQRQIRPVGGQEDGRSQERHVRRRKSGEGRRQEGSGRSEGRGSRLGSAHGHESVLHTRSNRQLGLSTKPNANGAEWLQGGKGSSPPPLRGKFDMTAPTRGRRSVSRFYFRAPGNSQSVEEALALIGPLKGPQQPTHTSSDWRTVSQHNRLGAGSAGTDNKDSFIRALRGISDSLNFGG